MKDDQTRSTKNDLRRMEVHTLGATYIATTRGRGGEATWVYDPEGKAIVISRYISFEEKALAEIIQIRMMGYAKGVIAGKQAAFSEVLREHASLAKTLGLRITN
jgi:hypothetical protein